MDEHMRHLFGEVERWGQEHDAHQVEHSRKMLNLEPPTAQLLSILVQNGQRTRLLEIGTSNGYSTIWLAWAAHQTGGHVISIEHAADKQAMAATNLQRAGLRALVTLYLGDATEVLRDVSGPFDVVFLDADRRQYPAQLPLIVARLMPNALLLADNVHSHPQEIAPYLEALRSYQVFEHVIVSVSKDLSVALKRT